MQIECYSISSIMSSIIPLNRLKPHRDILTLTLLFVSFRVMAILLFRPGGFIVDNSDYEYYYAWGQLGPMGYRAFENQWSVYPPLFTAIMLPIFELSSRIPPWGDPRLFFHTIFGGTLLLFETGNLLLIHRLARRLEPADHPQTPSLFQPALIYMLLFMPVHVLLGWFDSMTVFFMLLGLDRMLSARRGQWAMSAVAIALGFLTKLTPLVLIPIAIRWLGSKLSWQAARHQWFNPKSPGNLLRPALYVIFFIATVVSVSYPFVRENPSLAFSSLKIQQLRLPWQTVWALLDGYYGFGYVWDMRNLGILTETIGQSTLPWSWITVGFGLLYLWLYTRPYDWQKPRTAIAFAGVSLLWLFLYNKGWSPQFLLWILAFIVLLLPNLYGIVLALMLTFLNFMESYIFLIMLPDERWIMVCTVLLRTLFFILLAVEFMGQIWPTAQQGQQMRRVSRSIAIGLIAITIIGTGVTTPYMARAYQAVRLAQHPCRATIEYLQQESDWPNRTIISAQIEVWRDLYPWLYKEYDFHVLDSYSYLDHPAAQVIGERLDTLTEQGEFWWIMRDDLKNIGENSALIAAQDYLQMPTHGPNALHLLETEKLDACEISRVVIVPEQEALAVADTDESGVAIYLKSATLEQVQVVNELHLVLYWQANMPIVESYTVFTQVFDSTGQMVAQQDNLPVRGLAPTNTWQPGIVVRDPYNLRLPDSNGLEPYRLWVGLYDENGRRMLTLPNGSSSDHIEFSVKNYLTSTKMEKFYKHGDDG